MDIKLVAAIAKHHAIDGWSFNVAMKKAGINGQNKIFKLLKDHEEFREVKDICNRSRLKKSFITNETNNK